MGGKQLGFGDYEQSTAKKQTKREKFLSEMDKVVTWQLLIDLIEPFYPKTGSKGGRPPYPLATMLRIHLMQQWYFTSTAIEAWSLESLAPGCVVFSDGLACFRAVAAAGCDHVPVVIGGRKPKDVPLFQWLNTIIGNVKTALSGTHHAFDFKKYGDRYLAEISYRFNRRFYLKGLLQRLLLAGIGCEPQPERLLRSAELCC